MEQQKTRTSCSCSNAHYLSAFRLLQETKSVSQRSRTYQITRGTQLIGQLGRLSNGGISTIPNRTNLSAHAIFWWQRIKKYCVTGYALEVRKESGDPYTPQSIVQLISGLNRKISLHGSGVNITDNKCPSFQPLHTVLDNHFSSLHSQGIGTVRKQAGLLSPLKKKIDYGSWRFWALRPPCHCWMQCSCTMVSILCWGEGKSTMDSSCHSSPLVKWKIQMILHLNWPFFFFFRYDEHGSKNRAGGPKQLNLENKSNTQFTRKDTVSRCRYTLLQKYVSKLPPTTVTKDLFYCKPMHFKDSIPSDRPWYTDVPIWHNILQVKLKA